METAVKEELGYINRVFELRSDWIAMTAIVSAEEAVAVIKRLYEGDKKLDFVAMRCELEQWDRDNDNGRNEFMVAFSRVKDSSETTVEVVSTADVEYILFSRKITSWQLQNLADSGEYDSDEEFEEVFATKFVGNAGRFLSEPIEFK